MNMEFAPTSLRQVSPRASHDHFNHCEPLKLMHQPEQTCLRNSCG